MPPDETPSPEKAHRDCAIVLTPPGAAGIAVVRLVGVRVSAFLAAHFARAARAGRTVYGEMRDGDLVIDDAVVVLNGDQSLADVNLHGGEWVVRAFLDLAQRYGFDVIENIRLPLHPMSVEASSPIEREVLTHLPMARTELALTVLLAQPRAWERLPSFTAPEMESVLADRSLWWLLHMPRVAILGPANAGKSTLANQLFAQQRSITADLPGTTRDWVGEVANLDGLAVMLIDTPGLRQTTDAIEAQAISLAQDKIAQADLVVLVLDATRPLEPEQRALVQRFGAAIQVINKTDRPAAWNLDQFSALHTVATTGRGVDKLRSAIRRAFHCQDLRIDQPRCWTERQRDLLHRALQDPTALAEICAPPPTRDGQEPHPGHPA